MDDSTATGQALEIVTRELGANSPVTPLLQKRSVLIVDESIGTCHLLRELLVGLGAKSDNISICGNLLLARKRLDLAPIDIIISELHLKDGKGLELLYAAQAMKQEPSPVFLLMTRDPITSLLLESIRLGVSSIIVKPITAQNLSEHLLFALERSIPVKRSKKAPSVEAFFHRLAARR